MKLQLRYLVLALGFGLALSGCTSSAKEENNEDIDDSIPQMATPEPVKSTPREIKSYEVDEAFQQQLKSAFTAYVILKDAFVASDEALVLNKVKDFKKALGAVDAKILPEGARNDWMEYLDGMETSLIEMEGFEDLDAQRGSLSILSDNLYYSIKAFGADDAKVFYQFCPMAFENRGAHWLSDNSTIKNPYFGDKMLTCGSVEEVVE